MTDHNTIIVLLFGVFLFIYIANMVDMEEPTQEKKDYLKTRILNYLQALCPDKFIVPITCEVEPLKGNRYSVVMTLGFSDMEKHAEHVKACFLVIQTGDDIDIQHNSEELKKYFA